MTTEEYIYQLEAVVRTLDNRLSVCGLENMETIVGCARIVQGVVSDLKQSVSKQSEGAS